MKRLLPISVISMSLTASRCDLLPKPPPPQPRDQLDTYASLLTHHVRACATKALVHNEIHDLSTHLARTYEELHLLYRISSGMSVGQTPTRHFETLCKELLRATPVAGFAVILEQPAHVSGGHALVRTGTLPASPEDLIRLYDVFAKEVTHTHEATVINDAGQHPSLAWAGSWLTQCAFFSSGQAGSHLWRPFGYQSHGQ